MATKAEKKARQPSNLFPRDIPRMPDGYYSGDKPNPNLRAFVEQHLREKPYDPATDDYDVPAFNKPIETTKGTAIYNMHTYWSKKPHDAISRYICHYTKPGDLVLDPFCGSGGTALAALMEGRKAIAIDRSPAATFITKNYCTPVDPDELREAFEQVKAKVKNEIDWLYETKCDRCDGRATTAYTVYSQVFQCPRCLEKVPLFDCVEVDGQTAAGKPCRRNVCPHCHRKGHEEVIRSQSQKFGSVPVLISYTCNNGCKPPRAERAHRDLDKKKRDCFDNYDLGRLRDIEAKPIPHWYPRGHDMTGFSRYQRDALFYYGVREVCDLFTKRNLWALATWLGAIEGGDFAISIRDALRFLFTSNAYSGTRLQQYHEGGGGFQRGTFYLPQLSLERNQGQCIERKLGDLLSGYEEIRRQLKSTAMMCSTQSSADLSALPTASVDYIFTDPPYAEKVQYGELNSVWEAWLKTDADWLGEEVIVNETRGRSESDWSELMRRILAECYRVLKPGHWLSLCYHDTSEGTWELIQDIAAEVGLVVDTAERATFIATREKSSNQRTADKVTKTDLVINFRKLKPGEFRVARLVIPENADLQTFRELAHQVIRDHLQANPGSTKDRVYDELVSRMVRAGTMQTHNFDELLREVAEEAAMPGGSSRWYLKEAEETQLDASEQQAEDRAAVVMEKFIAKNTDETNAEGVHYSDLFEHYLYAVKDKPRRPLADWLPDYYFKTEFGTWRLPESDEERELKEKSRTSGVNRRIKRYANMLSAGVVIPQSNVPTSASLAEWIRHAKRASLYEAGKLLYERGGLELEKLPEEVQVAVEEDYQTCIRALQRAAGADVEAKKRGRRNKVEAEE